MEWKDRLERQLDRIALEAAAAAEAGGWAREEQRTALQAEPLAWQAALRRLIHQTDEAMVSAGDLQGEVKDQVVADLKAERERLSEALERVAGERIEPPALTNGKGPAKPEAVTASAPGTGAGTRTDTTDGITGVPLLQASWAEGRVVVWAAGRGAVGSAEQLEALLAAADASGVSWERHVPVPLPNGESAEARSAPLPQTLGWLVGIAAGQVSGGTASGHAETGELQGASLRWMGEVAAWGTALVAEGRMVPVIRGTQAGTNAKSGAYRHRVRWVPALMARDRLQDLVSRMPGAVNAVQPVPQPETVCRSMLAAVVDAVCRAGAGRLVAPAASPRAATRPEVAEAVLSGLDGRPFLAEAEPAGRVGDDLKRWAAPVTGNLRVGLIVRLDPPGPEGGWLLTIEASGVDKHPMPVEHALVVTSGAKSQQVEAQLHRLERLVPALRRPTTRRGQVVLDAEEASELMFNTGPILQCAGFQVMLPRVSRRRPSPQLRLWTETAGKSQVGLQQLTNVRWTVIFEDLELDAAEVIALAKEAKPLVQVRGRWVHIDRADLSAAAEALAERASMKQMTGAEVLRHAVGLEGSSLGSSVRVEGSGWAADLLRGATSHPPAPIDTPDGFRGQLRSYQAEAAGWLGFLDRAGLGGCLAMDMGLGKTPTLLAHVLVDRGHGPVLVICPPAVLTNWETEAKRFTPSLRVVAHHGPRRAETKEALAKLASSSDVVLTTYSTAVRDMDVLSTIEWRRVVVDEAQAIKNFQSDTAQGLRRLKATSRLALTGTPVENGLGDLWAILDFTNPGLVGGRNSFVEHLSRPLGTTNAAEAPMNATGERAAETAANGAVPAPVARPEEHALRALNGLLIFRRTKSEPEIAAELPDKVDKLDSCAMTPEQIGLYQAVLDRLLEGGLAGDANHRKGQVLAAITALKQICDHPAAYLGADDEQKTLVGRSGKLTRLEEIISDVIAAGERLLVFTHFARWGEKLADYLTSFTGLPVGCYHGGLTRSTRDELIKRFQATKGPGALVLSIKAGGSGLNLTAANHVVLYDRWWNPAVEDQARDRAWRIGQHSAVVCHRLVCPGTVDERVEEIVSGKREVAGMVLPARSGLGDLDAEQIKVALGLRPDDLVEDEPTGNGGPGEGEEAA